MRKRDISSVTIYDIDKYSQRILTARIVRAQYKRIQITSVVIIK